MVLLVTGHENHFNKTAPNWRQSVLNTRWKHFQQVPDFLDLQGNENIVEIGAGTGELLKYLASKTNGRVIGIDEAPNMVSETKKILRNVQNAFVIRRDATKTNLPDGFADVVISFHTYQWVEDRKKLLKEMMRIVRPGGKILLATVTEESFKQNKEFLQHVIRKYPYHYVADNPDTLMGFRTFTSSQLERELVEVGLKNIKINGPLDEIVFEVEPYIKKIDAVTDQLSFKPLISNPKLLNHVRNCLRPKILQRLLKRDGKLVMEKTLIAVAYR